MWGPNHFADRQTDKMTDNAMNREIWACKDHHVCLFVNMQKNIEISDFYRIFKS